jgi:hypothetical protein
MLGSLYGATSRAEARRSKASNKTERALGYAFALLVASSLFALAP